MDPKKGFFTYLSEALDQYRKDHRNSDQQDSVAKRFNGLRWMGRQLVPNLGSVVLVFLLLSVFPGIAAPLLQGSATSISTIPYQGRLADAAGNPVTGKQNMEFRIYTVPTGGEPLWEEFWTGGNSVDVSDGLFSVMLGSLNTNLTSVVQGHDQLYLGITIGTDSEMDPRVQLGSVPFAMQSLTVPDGSITTAKLGNGSVTSNKIAINAVGSSQIISGSVTTEEIADGAVTSDKIASDAVGSDQIIDNGVTTEEIADGAVKSRQMDALEAYSYVAAQEGTTSITWIDLTSPQSITLQLEVPQTVYFLYKATVNADATTLPYIALFIDGELHDGSWLDCGIGVSYEVCSGFYRAQLPAGNHVVSIKYRVAGGHPGTATYWRRSLLAFSVTQ